MRRSAGFRAPPQWQPANHCAPVLLCGWTDTTQGLTHAALNPEALIGCFNHVELLAPRDKAELDRMLCGGGLFDGPKFLLLKPL